MADCAANVPEFRGSVVVEVVLATMGHSIYREVDRWAGVTHGVCVCWCGMYIVLRGLVMVVLVAVVLVAVVLISVNGFGMIGFPDH